MEQFENIRNFVVISHIDHGKSTLADRFLEITKTVNKREMKPQYLDQLELERERGITIKMAPVRMKYAPQKNADSTRNNAEDLLYGDITYEIRAAAFEVRKSLGLGHKEGVYHNALIQEFSKRGLRFEDQRSVDIFYAGKKVGSYRPDFIIEDKVIIELKALPELGRPQTEQLWSYLKGSDYKLALLVNFGSKELEIKRIVYDIARLPRNSASGQRGSAQVEEYILNLIDTPGHADFSYEVSRALASVEGAILLVDATQGIQAQTLANFENAAKAGLRIIGAINKIDIATPEQVESSAAELTNLLGADPSQIFKISGKTGEGVPELLAAVIKRIPAPKTQINADQNADKRGYISVNQRGNPRESAMPAARALIFDSLYDDHKGVIAFVRVMNGEYRIGDNVQLIASDYKFKIKEVGWFSPQLTPAEKLNAGEIGYIVSGIKDLGKLKIGDTVISADLRRFSTQINADIRENPRLDPRESASLALPGYEEPKPVVFVSLYPEESDEYEDFKIALFKLKLNDSSLSLEPDFNEVLGRGFRSGFLGQLHFEITVERLEREFKIKTVSTFPLVAYKIRSSKGEELLKKLDDFSGDSVEIFEPMIKVSIIAPLSHLGNILQIKARFLLDKIETRNWESKILITARMPLASLLYDFYGQLKSISSGMASFSYEMDGYAKADLEKVEIMIAGEVQSGLGRLIYKNRVEGESRKILLKLKDVLPRQQFSQALQAVSGGRIIARETIPAMRKDVTGYLYGGDRTRKMKLWKKQKKGKKKLQERGRVFISANVFRELLKK